ncbi:hypothetical protein LEP1GSC194_3054 [Leptospira alstonii serovar Sichuan str. 79601]|uniref:Uncharacterized protein n=1 Tax=Leptospira alstonii serovar Sichuan str. 79601 TaxID=1218565 RepID=M6DGE8_9LEPT|nr:hypothetical protein LEP1GSC194_3054 [Leptospira alstonii serovar Sichuan str. 79601]
MSSLLSFFPFRKTRLAFIKRILLRIFILEFLKNSISAFNKMALFVLFVKKRKRRKLIFQQL